MGLTINITKTEVVCRWSTNIPSTPPIFSITDKHLSVVPSFKHLGSILSEDNNIDNEVQNRINQASAAFGRLRRRVFQNKNLYHYTKISVYKAVCITTLLYSCEAWVTYSRHVKSRDGYRLVFIRYRYITDTFKTIPVPKRCRNRYFYKKIKKKLRLTILKKGFFYCQGNLFSSN